MTAESFVIGMLSGSYSVLSIQQATVNKQDLFYIFWLFHYLPSKSQDNHITITQRLAETCFTAGKNTFKKRFHLYEEYFALKMVKLTADLINGAMQHTNPVRERELDLSGE